VVHSRPDDREDEERSEHRLDPDAEERRDPWPERRRADVRGMPRIGEDRLEGEAGGEGADELRDDVGRRLHRPDLAHDPHRERDGGVEVPAGDRAERRDEHCQGKPVGQRHAEQPGARAAVRHEVVAEHDGACADEEEEEGADRLGDERGAAAGHGRCSFELAVERSPHSAASPGTRARHPRRPMFEFQWPLSEAGGGAQIEVINDACDGRRR
jgi:hypothetical protein